MQLSIPGIIGIVCVAAVAIVFGIFWSRWDMKRQHTTNQSKEQNERKKK